MEPDQHLKPWPLCFTIFGLGTIAAIIYVLFCAAGCSATSLSSKDFTMRTQGNIKGFDRKPDGSIHIDELNHSTPTLAGGKAISSGATAFGSAATGLAAGLFTHGLK